MSVTILRSTWNEARAYKYWPAGATAPQDYKLGAWFVGVAHPCESLSDLYEILKSLENEPQSVIVRGGLAPDVEDPRRRSFNTIEDEPAGLVKFDSRLVALDVDTVKPPVDGFLEGVAWLREQLGWNAGCIAQATSKAEKPDFRCRLWYWADKGISDEELVARLQGLPFRVDVSVARGCQPIYTAKPGFEVPEEDPFQGRDRLVFLDGPELDIWSVPRIGRVDALPDTPAVLVSKPWSRFQLAACDRELAKWVDKLESCRADRPALLLKASSRLARLVAPGWSSKEAVEEHLLSAFVASYATETVEGSREAGADDSTVREGIRLIAQGFRYAASNPEITKPPRSLSETDITKAKTARSRAKKAIAENTMLLPVYANSYAGQISKGIITRESAVNELRDALIDGGVKGSDAQTQAETALSEADAIKGKREAAEWQDGLSVTESGEVKATQANLNQIMRLHPEVRDKLYFDARNLKVVVSGKLPWTDKKVPRFLEDQDAAWACEWLASHGVRATSAKITQVYDALVAAAHRNPVDPFLNYLEDLEWDQKPRLDEWLVNYAGVEDTTYTRVVGAKILIAAVARAYQPGAKVDTMVVLEGDQGAGKSTMLRALVGRPEWFTEVSCRGFDKDTVALIHGPVIVEMGELASLKSWEVENTKAFLSREKDDFRPAYGRTKVSFLRRCVLFGTTNAETYLPDTTGNRRFWPVQVHFCDVDGITEDRDQLWAEAVVQFKAGRQWWLTSEEEKLAQVEQDLRREVDPFEEKLDKLLSQSLSPSQVKKVSPDAIGPDGRLLSVTTGELAALMLLQKYDRTEQTRIGATLRMWGWQVVRHRVGESRARRYHRP